MEIRIKRLDPDIIAPSTSTYMRADQGGSKIVIIGKPGCFAKGTRVRMTNGSVKAIEDIDIGEYVLGMYLQPCQVLELCRGEEEMYRLSYSISSSTKKHSVIVNKHHMLTLWDIHHYCIIDLPLTFFLRYPEKRHAYQWISVPLVSNKYVDTSYKEMKLPSKYLSNWEVEFVQEKGEYYGFSVESERFLLEDGSVVHNTGKTTLITSLLFEKSHIFPVGMIMSGTEDSNGHYRKIFPSTFVFNQLEEKRIEDFITRQKIAKLHIPNPWGILLLDDCTDDPKVLSKPLFQSLYKNGRHWKLLFILSLQYCMDVKPVVRTNIDGTFILRESSLRNRKVLWENYASIIPDFSTFNAIMDQITDNYTALYIHNATQSNKLEDCVFWYRAKPVPSNFRFGSPDYWKFHKQRYDTQYKDALTFFK